MTRNEATSYLSRLQRSHQEGWAALKLAALTVICECPEQDWNQTPTTRHHPQDGPTTAHWTDMWSTPLPTTVRYSNPDGNCWG